jgi:WD40 repeat protein
MFSRPKIKDLQGHKDTIHSIAFHHDRRFLTGSKDSTLRVWIDEKSTYLGSHKYSIDQVDWIQDQAIALSRDGIRIWDTHKRSARVLVNDAMEMCVSQHRIAVLDSMDRISEFDIRQKEPLRVVQSDVGVQQMTYGNDGWLYLATVEGQVRILGSQHWDLPAHSSSCTCISMDVQKRSFVTGGTDAVALVWDAASFLPQRTYIQHE